MLCILLNNFNLMFYIICYNFTCLRSCGLIDAFEVNSSEARVLNKVRGVLAVGVRTQTAGTYVCKIIAS
jgi:hypothetical protein